MKTPTKIKALRREQTAHFNAGNWPAVQRTVSRIVKLWALFHARAK